MLSVLALPMALVDRNRLLAVVLALFFWATFIADGFVVLSLRVGSHLYPRDQTAHGGRNRFGIVVRRAWLSSCPFGATGSI